MLRKLITGVSVLLLRQSPYVTSFLEVLQLEGTFKEFEFFALTCLLSSWLICISAKI